MEMSLKAGFAQIFSCYPKNPAPMPMFQLISIPDPLSSPFDDDVMTQ